MARFVAVGATIHRGGGTYSRSFRVLDTHLDFGVTYQSLDFDAAIDDYPTLKAKGDWVRGFDFTERVHAECMAAVLNSGWTTVKAQAGDGYPE